MLVFVLILLLLAAIFGVLGAVVKVAFVLVLAALLAVATLTLFGYYWFRHRLREYASQVPPGTGASPVQPRPGSSVIDVGEPVRDDPDQR